MVARLAWRQRRQELETHYHLRSGSPQDGILLGPGAILQAGDKLAHPDGFWEPCMTPGALLWDRPKEVCWVRPVDLPRHLKDLLVFIAERGRLLYRRDETLFEEGTQGKIDTRPCWKMLRGAHEVDRADATSGGIPGIGALAFVDPLLAYGLLTPASGSEVLFSPNEYGTRVAINHLAERWADEVAT
ncbi:hypothetical protein CL654_01045 [bacterium]|nr:hypothetical protein [bacterium]